MAESCVAITSVREVSPLTYESVHKPQRMGNAAAIAYGGCALGCGINAACTTVPKTHLLYSAVGSYLGPALIDRHLLCTVKPLRDTKTFATRYVEVSQTMDDGKSRACMSMIVDFQVPEAASVLVYSSPPSKKYSSLEESVPMQSLRDDLAKRGGRHAKIASMHSVVFGMMSQFFDARSCPEGIFAQNLTGMLKDVETTQDSLLPHEKSTADWIKARHTATTHNEHAAVLSFHMDGGIAFAGLSFNHLFLDDVAACSSLEFALRIFVNDLDVNAWHLKEITTSTSGAGRSYNEARLWKDGTLVASMTQQSINRPKPQKL